MTNILFLVPSKLDGPSARYVLDLADVLIERNKTVFISSEEESQKISRVRRGQIVNIKLPSLNNKEDFTSYLNLLTKVDYDIVIAIGSRFKIDLVLLHLKRLGAVCLKQFEDDEETIFVNCNKGKTVGDYWRLIEAGYSAQLDESKLLSLYKSDFNVVDPYVKGLTLSRIDGYAKIWAGLKFEEEKFLEGLRFFSLPPVCSDIEIKNVFKKDSLGDKEENNYFIGGSIYSKEDADIFISAWIEFKKEVENSSLLISYSRTSKQLIKYLLDTYDNKYGIRVLDLPNDTEYLKVLSESKFVLSIGGGKFDEKRLPSRLVKAMFLGKNIVCPAAGFGLSLEDKVNAYVSSDNTKIEWLSTLRKTRSDRLNNIVSKNAKRFAFENFDINNVAEVFVKYISQFSFVNSLAANGLASIENCMMADNINLLNTFDAGASRPPIRKIKFRLVLVNNVIFLQTLDREDYNFQVNCSSKALIEDGSNELECDTGFMSLRRFGEVEIFGKIYSGSISVDEVRDLMLAFRGKFDGLSSKGRSALFDKLYLSYRLAKILSKVILDMDVKLLVCHADMQPVEALVSSVIKAMHPRVKTASLQHALYYSTEDDNDVNVVNTKVSPCEYSFYWDEHISSVVTKFNPNKKAVKTLPFPSMLMRGLDDNSSFRRLLVILDGPNHDAYNEELLKLCDRLVVDGELSSYFIKAHPYHSSETLRKVVNKDAAQIIVDIDSYYENVVFISSTLGVELFNHGFRVFQFVPDGFTDHKKTFDHLNVQRFKSLEFLESKLKGNSKELVDIPVFNFDNVVDDYHASFKKAVKSLLA